MQDQTTDGQPGLDQSFVLRGVALAAISLALLAGCSGHDSDYIPFALTGFDSWVYNDETDQEFYAGRAEASYLSRKEGLDSCQRAAYIEARRRHLDDWSYVCCTVTRSSDCVTKVR